MPEVRLQAFDRDRDTRLVATWLHQPDAARWWGEPESALAEVREHPANSAALIVADGKSVGFLCWQSPSRAELQEAGLADLPDDLVDIDILIGDPTATGRGVGPEALRQLFDDLEARGVHLMGTAAALANQRAVRAYAKAGLQPYRDFTERGERYRYFTRRSA